MKYSPGVEVQIAQKLYKLSKKFDKFVVNLTGGEPTIAPQITDVVKILSKNENIEIRLITNLQNVDRFVEIVPFISNVLVSLHISFRDENDIDNIISVVQKYKDHVPITISQVDCDLSMGLHAKLAQIQDATGLPIQYQTFIPPWTEPGNLNEAAKINVANFRKSFGKRCALGHFFFFIDPDGTLKYDLWCSPQTSKQTSILSIDDEGFFSYILPDMKKCPKETCGCNYNYIFHNEYIRECQLKKYPQKEFFNGGNETQLSRFKRLFSKLKTTWSNG